MNEILIGLLLIAIGLLLIIKFTKIIAEVERMNDKHKITFGDHYGKVDKETMQMIDRLPRYSMEELERLCENIQNE